MANSNHLSSPATQGPQSAGLCGQENISPISWTTDAYDDPGIMGRQNSETLHPSKKELALAWSPKHNLDPMVSGSPQGMRRLCMCVSVTFLS